MILGLDVGGTQTDTVLVAHDEITRATKPPTGENLLETLRVAVDETMGDFDPGQHIMAVHIPVGACKACQEMGHAWFDQGKRGPFSHVYLQDRVNRVYQRTG